jgi:two-component system, sporulation sensor kinase E
MSMFLNEHHRQMVEDSWKRCLSLGVDPEGKPRCVSSSELEHLRKKNHTFLRVAIPFINSLLMPEQDFIMGINEENGCILEVFGSYELVRRVQSFHIRPGAVWTEESIGTNAIGTSIVLNKPVLIRKEEHFHRSQRSMICFSAPICDGQGHYLGALSVGSNKELDPVVINMVKAAARAIEKELHLTQQNQELELLNNVLFESSHRLMLMVSRDGRVLRANRKMLQEIPGAVGRHVGELFPDEEESVATILLESMEKEIEYVDREIQVSLQAVPVQKKYFTIDTRLIRNHRNQVTGVVGTMRDITEKKQMDRHMIQNEKLIALGQLAAGLAHEIRNPLTSSLGFLQLLKNGDLECKKDYLELIYHEMKRINSLLTEFVMLSKPIAPMRKAVDLSDLLQNVVSFLQPQALLHNVQLSYLPLTPLPIVNIDAKQMKQVLLNVIKNAIEASGVVEVVLLGECREEDIHIEVRDNGSGIPRGILDQIFNPFYTTKDEGTGLGLPISLQIVQNHGGHMTVESEEGKGTSVHIFLPLSAVQVEAIPAMLCTVDREAEKTV